MSLRITPSPNASETRWPSGEPGPDLHDGLSGPSKLVNMVLNVHRNHKAYQGRGKGGGREIIYLSLHCHHQNDSCIKMGSGESHFNVSVGSDGQSHKTVSTNHNLFEEKGEPKRYRTLRLTARPNRLTWRKHCTLVFCPLMNRSALCTPGHFALRASGNSVHWHNLGRAGATGCLPSCKSRLATISERRR